MSNSHFDEKSGVICHEINFGRWYQTVSEVTILVDVEKARAKDVKVEIKPNKLKCMVHGKIIFDGQPFSTVIEDESTWTIEDQKLLRIQLTKTGDKTKDECWLSLLKDQFYPDPLILNEMRKKLDLERFQLENPGFDFSGAKLDKKYEDKSVMEMEKAIKNTALK